MKTKLRFRFISLISLVLIVVSCEERAVIIPKPEIIDPATTFLQAVKSDSLTHYYIAADFNGKHICCTWPSESIISDSFIFNNAYYKNSTGQLDQMNLIRSTKDSLVTIAIYFDHGHIFSRKIPFLFSPSTFSLGEFVLLEFTNNKSTNNVIPGDNKDDFNFVDVTNQTGRVMVTSTTDSIIIGTFNAVLKTNTGSKIIVKNGSFRIKIKVINQ